MNFYKDKTDKKDKDEGFDVKKGTKRSRVEDTPQATGKEDMKDYKVLRHLDLQGGLPMQVKSSPTPVGDAVPRLLASSYSCAEAESKE